MDENISFLERKHLYFSTHKRVWKRKRWYYNNYPYYRLRIRIKRVTSFLEKLRLPNWLSFVRWIVIDFLRAKQRRFWGIYQFVALPGEGKTLSMVAHMERARANYPDLVIATNFNYKCQQYKIEHWTDIIKVALIAKKQRKPCIIAMDEIHVSFDASDWQKFPAELLALLSFNRKFSLQFLCSAQIYDRIPRKIRDIANYTVLCKNVWKADRYFINYYFDTNNYEIGFTGKRAKADFVRDFIATDDLYALYDTLEQVENMSAKAADEQDKKQAAFDLLFGPGNSDDEALLRGVFAPAEQVQK